MQLFAEQLLFSSFNHHWLQRLKKRRPDALIGALVPAVR